MLRPVIRGSNRLIGGSWFFRLRLHSLGKKRETGEVGVGAD